MYASALKSPLPPFRKGGNLIFLHLSVRRRAIRKCRGAKLYAHLSVRRWAIRKWRGAKLYAPRRKMPSFRTETSRGVEFVPGFPDGFYSIIDKADGAGG